MGNPRTSSSSGEVLEVGSSSSWKLKFLIALLVIVLLGLVVTIPLLTTVLARHWDTLGKLRFKPNELKLRVVNTRSSVALAAFLGKNTTVGSLTERSSSSDSLLYKFSTDITLEITTKHQDRCYEIAWSASGKDVDFFMDCFELGDLYHLYGGSELFIQAWPLEKADIEMQPFLPSDCDSFTGAYGAVLERYWLTSRGGAILVDDAVPLHVSLNSEQICLKADSNAYPQPSKPPQLLQLNYILCIGEDVKDVHRFMAKAFLASPASIPDRRMIEEPIWSTWARYKTDINQSVILSFAAEIKEHGFPYSQVEIDDKYSNVYGDFDFNLTKFPDAKLMVRKLHDDNFRVTVWVYPYASPGSEAFKEGFPYWVRGSDGLPGLMKWWNGIGVALDTTNPQGKQWYYGRLKAFQEMYELDSFKFDGGGLSYVPEDYKLHNATGTNPSSYSTNYASLAAMFGNLTEVRVGYRSQHFPLFVRILDRASRWDETNGLRSVIPATFTFGILGYPFVLPDMIGGNAYTNGSSAQGSVKPEKELYIRWLQLNVFLPAMQFSIPPWDYDRQTIQIALEMMALRRNISRVIIQLALQATQNNDPIIRPLWWLVPDDPVAQKMYSEFLVGDVYLVAPVLEKHQETQGVHNVYLPKGTWREEFGSRSILHVAAEGLWVNYNVTLNDVPFFSLL